MRVACTLVGYSSVLEYLCVSASCVPCVWSCVSGDLCGDRSVRASATHFWCAPACLDIRQGFRSRGNCDQRADKTSDHCRCGDANGVSSASLISHVLAMDITIRSSTRGMKVTRRIGNVCFTSSCTQDHHPYCRRPGWMSWITSFAEPEDGGVRAAAWMSRRMRRSKSVSWILWSDVHDHTWTLSVCR